jgi:S-adenosylmethionine decarboxylase proenzyme
MIVEEAKLRQLGLHILLEVTGCRSDLLDNIEDVRETLIQAALAAKATVLDDSFHKFSPQGVSGVVVIEESHISIHTWPEFGYAAIDVFTCGDRAMPKRAAEYLISYFKPAMYDLKEMPRGIPHAPNIQVENSGVNWTPPAKRGWA